MDIAYCTLAKIITCTLQAEVAMDMLLWNMSISMEAILSWTVLFICYYMHTLLYGQTKF